MYTKTRYFKCNQCSTGTVTTISRSQGFFSSLDITRCSGCGASFYCKSVHLLEEINPLLEPLPEKTIARLSQIDTSTETGKMLLAAVAYMTDTVTSITPEEALASLMEYRNRAFKEEPVG